MLDIDDGVVHVLTWIHIQRLSAFIMAVLGAVVQAILVKTGAASENMSNAVLCLMAALWWGGFGFIALNRMKLV